MKKILVLLSIILIGLLAACGGGGGDDGEASSSESNHEELSTERLVVGVTAGPHEQIMEKVKEIAANDGLEIEIKVFSDYVMPNTALDEGELDVNSYQHEPFLIQFNEDRGTDLVAKGATILNPMGVYSEKVKSIDDIKEGAKIGLPNDPTNGARALAIFEDAGLIKLPEDKKQNATIYDIEENPLNLEFIELDAAQIPKQLSELEAAAINTNYALPAGLNPGKDAIFQESADSPYMNYLAVRKENENDPALDKLIKAYHTDEVKQFVEDEFAGAIITGW